jgi:hypothetical protein
MKPINRSSFLAFIGDLQVANGRRGVGNGRVKLLPSNYWNGTLMQTPTFWEDECVKLREKGIPVHAFYVKNQPHIAQHFQQISAQAGPGGRCEFLDIKDPQGDALLLDLLTSEILKSFGDNEDQKKQLMEAYRAKFPEPRIMH